MIKNPPPPEVGDVFRGPSIGHGVPVVSRRGGLYYVRAVVDVEEDDEVGWFYQVVLRFWTRNKGWRYSMESSFAFAPEFSRFKKVNKRRGLVTLVP